MICYITTNLNRSFIIVYITFVSYTDIEVELEPSDEEFTDCVGKLILHLKEAKYILVFTASLDVLIKINFIMGFFHMRSLFCRHKRGKQ